MCLWVYCYRLQAPFFMKEDYEYPFWCCLCCKKADYNEWTSEEQVRVSVCSLAHPHCTHTCTRARTHAHIHTHKHPHTQYSDAMRDTGAGFMCAMLFVVGVVAYLFYDQLQVYAIVLGVLVGLTNFIVGLALIVRAKQIREDATTPRVGNAISNAAGRAGDEVKSRLNALKSQR